MIIIDFKLLTTPKLHLISIQIYKLNMNKVTVDTSHYDSFELNQNIILTF